MCKVFFFFFFFLKLNIFTWKSGINQDVHGLETLKCFRNYNSHRAPCQCVNQRPVSLSANQSSDSRLRHRLWPQFFWERLSGWRRHFGRGKSFQLTLKSRQQTRCCTWKTTLRVSSALCRGCPLFRFAIYPLRASNFPTRVPPDISITG